MLIHSAKIITADTDLGSVRTFYILAFILVKGKLLMDETHNFFLSSVSVDIEQDISNWNNRAGCLSFLVWRWTPVELWEVSKCLGFWSWVRRLCGFIKLKWKAIDTFLTLWFVKSLKALIKMRQVPCFTNEWWCKYFIPLATIILFNFLFYSIWRNRRILLSWEYVRGVFSQGFWDHWLGQLYHGLHQNYGSPRKGSGYWRTRSK